MDGDIDYRRYSAAKLVEMIPRIDREQYPLSYENAWRALREKWPEAPADLRQVAAGPVPRPHSPVETLPDGTKRFAVRFRPPGPPFVGTSAPNNLGLSTDGMVEVGPDRINFIETAGSIEIRRKWFERAKAGNVEWLDEGTAVIVRTLDGERFVTVWLNDKDEAAQFTAMLPVGLTPEFRHRREHERTFVEQVRLLSPRQWVTPTLIGINALVFAVMACFGAGFFGVNSEVHLRFGSNFVAMTWTGEPWRLLTNVFIHFGLWHLVFNMIALWFGGLLCERLYGSARFLVIYLLAALAGSVVSGWWDSVRNSAGASGAIFGVYGALLVFLAVRRRDIPIKLLKRASWAAVLLIGYSFATGYSQLAVDSAAHAGGILCGIFAGLLLARPFNVEARLQPQPLRVAGVAAATCVGLLALSTSLWIPGGVRAIEHRYLLVTRDFMTAEPAFIEEYLAIERDEREGRLTKAEAGQRLETKLIPAWQKLMKPFRAIPPFGDSSRVIAQRLALMKIYGEARENGMRLQAEAWLGKAAHDQAEIDEHWTRMSQAADGLKHLRE